LVATPTRHSGGNREKPGCEENQSERDKRARHVVILS
jgi:hypothetical protein